MTLRALPFKHNKLTCNLCDKMIDPLKEIFYPIVKDPITKEKINVDFHRDCLEKAILGLVR